MENNEIIFHKGDRVEVVSGSTFIALRGKSKVGTIVANVDEVYSKCYYNDCLAVDFDDMTPNLGAYGCNGLASPIKGRLVKIKDLVIFVPVMHKFYVEVL